MHGLATDVMQRLALFGDSSATHLNLAADIISAAANRSAEWTHRADDAERIPTMLYEVSQILRDIAKKQSQGR